MGYYNDPDKTAAAFVQNPLQSHYPERVYKTGDLVRWNERGELIYLSRRDFQIKHMGYRIELGEIEAAATAQPGVDVSVCLYDQAADQLILIYVGAKAEQETVRAGIGGQRCPHICCRQRSFRPRLSPTTKMARPTGRRWLPHTLTRLTKVHSKIYI